MIFSIGMYPKYKKLRERKTETRNTETHRKFLMRENSTKNLISGDSYATFKHSF